MRLGRMSNIFTNAKWFLVFYIADKVREAIVENQKGQLLLHFASC